MATSTSKDEDNTNSSTTAPGVDQISQDIQHGQDKSDEDKSAEQEEREQAVKDAQIEQIENDQLNLNPYNDNESAHQRWLETGQTEPPFMIPEQSEDEDDDDEGEGRSQRSATAKKQAVASSTRKSTK